MNSVDILLNQGLSELPVKLSSTTQQQLIHYLELLVQWNQVYNLTAIREITEMVPKHVLDSLAILPYLQGTTILDVGTGAGIPGLVLALACPQWHYTLIDKSAKKVRFIQQAIIELNLTHVEVISTRIEAFKPGYFFNSIISRAYSNLTLFYQQTIALCANDGCLLAMKGNYPASEISALAKNSVHLECFPLQVPQLMAQRHLVKITRCLND
jgi:16S rRNA (guanine527-N7)-methyltransferase